MAKQSSKNISKTDFLKEIRFDLKNNVDEKYKKDSQKYFKEKISSYGVRTPYVRKIASKYFKIIKGWEKKEIFDMCEDLLKTDYNEESTIAIQWMSKLRDLWEPGDFIVFDRWLTKYINNWGKTDDFCLSVLSHFIIKFPGFKEKVKQWSSSKNQWKRRASAVAFIQGGSWRISDRYLKDVFEIAINLMDDKDDLVQKGYGWMLKVAADSYQKEVFNFVLKNKAKMTRTALRYAIEKMPVDLKKKAMGM